MTYGTLDGSTVAPTPAATPPAVQQWDPTTFQTSQHGPAQSTAPAPPLVPSNSGTNSAGVRVDTPSLKVFADNIGQLVQPVKDAMTKLDAMKPVAAGGFYQASQIRSHVVGNDGTGGLKGSYHTVLNNVLGTLMDTQTAMSKLAKDYETTEDANNMNASAITKAMGTVSTDVGSITSTGGTTGS